MVGEHIVGERSHVRGNGPQNMAPNYIVDS